MNKLVSVVSILAVVAMAWLSYQTQLKLEHSQRQIVVLQESLILTQKELSQLNMRVSELDKTSVQGLVKEANGAILDGWEALVNSVENEVKKAREAMNHQNSTKINPQIPEAPKLESPDGSDRI